MFLSLHQNQQVPEWLQQYPVAIIQLLSFIHYHNDEFVPTLLTCPVVTALSCTLFPLPQSTNNSISASSSANPTPNTSFSLPNSTTAKVSCSPNNTTEAVDHFEEEGELVFPNQGSSAGLSQHACFNDVISFLHQLILDSLIVVAPGKPPNVVDFVLDAAPEEASQAQVSR